MPIDHLEESLAKQKKIAEDIAQLSEELKNSKNEEERSMISAQLEALIRSLKESSKEILEATQKISVPKLLSNYQPATVSEKKPEEEKAQAKALGAQPVEIRAPQPSLTKLEPLWVKAQKGLESPEQEIPQVKGPKKKEKITNLEKLTLKRMKRKEKVVVKKKERKPNLYVRLASSIFSNISMALIKKGKFHTMRRDLIKANLEFVPANYISLVFLTTVLSFFGAIVVALFLLFFSLVASPPFIVPMDDTLGARFLKVFPIIFVIPTLTYLFAYFYPSMEKRSLESKLNHELPFAVIHMSSISSSMIEPSKIFTIIISTGEYVNLGKEFTKLLNEVNIYGYDLVTALRDMAFNSPSRKLRELYNGLATTINSGGDLPEFFNERAQTLLFEHKLEVEKQAKAAETFMDIYISVVIAAPMILMLLLMMMRISGLGISLSTGMITLVMVLGVSLMNILFLAFLQIKQPEGV